MVPLWHFFTMLNIFTTEIIPISKFYFKRFCIQDFNRYIVFLKSKCSTSLTSNHVFSQKTR